jgi:hypothetical protein
MAFEVGQRVIADKAGRRKRSHRVSRPPRHGVVEEVVRGDPRPRYRIKWDTGGESIFAPAESGALQADPGQPAAD